MALESAHGAVIWNPSHSVGTTYVVSGLSFQPKAIYAYALFDSAASLTVGTDIVKGDPNKFASAGFAISTSDRRCIAGASRWGQGAMTCATGYRTDCLVVGVDGTSPTISVGRLDISAISSSGFTLIVDEQPPNNVPVFWRAFGGSDITAAVTGEISEPAAIGTQTYTATGLVNDSTNAVLMFAGCQATGTAPAHEENDSGFCIGWARGVTSSTYEYATLIGNNDDGSASGDCDGYGSTQSALGMVTVAGGALNARATLTDIGTNGFTLDWLTRGVTGRKYIFLAIQGGNWKVGGLTINGNTASATATVSSLAFQPIGLSVMGRMTTEQTGTTTTIQDRLALGDGSSTSSRQTQAIWDQDGAGTSTLTGTAQYDQILAFPNAAGDAVQTAYDINAINSDGFQIIVDTAGGVASEWIGYLTFGNAGAVAPVLTADKVNYIVTGQAVGLLEAKRVIAVHTVYALAGQVALFAKGRVLTAVQTNYAITASATNLLEAKRITAAQITYALAGQAATFAKGRRLIAAQTTYAVTGQAVLLPKGRFITAAQTSYALTGRDAGLLEAKRIAAGQTAYVLTGTTTNFTKGRVLAAAQISYSLTSSAANLLEAKRLTATQTAYVITAPATALLKGRQVTAVLVTYTLTAQPATLLQAKRLTATQVGYTFTGRDATLTVVEAATMAAGLATYSLTSPAAQLLKAKRLTATQISYSLAGQAAGLLEAKRVIATATTYSLSAQAATLLEAKRLTAAQTAYTLTGRDATLVKVSARTLTASSASYGLTSPAIELRQARRLTAVAQTYSLNGQAAALTKGRRLTAAQAVYTLTGRDATLVYVPSARLVAAVTAYSLTGLEVEFTWTQLFRLVAEVGYYGLVGQPVRLLTILPAPPGGRPGYRRYARLPAQPASALAAMVGSRLSPMGRSAMVRPATAVIPAARSMIMPNARHGRMPAPRAVSQFRPPSGAILPPNRGAQVPQSPPAAASAANQPPGDVL